MEWYKKTILSNIEKILLWSTYWILCISITIILNYFYWWNFNREVISPIETPWIIPRIFLSALAFYLPWAFLYKIYFYKFFYNILSKREFRDFKKIVWISLILFMYFMVQVVVDFLNSVFSFCFNSYKFFIFISPWIWISLLSVFIIYLIYIKFKYIKTTLIIPNDWKNEFIINDTLKN